MFNLVPYGRNNNLFSYFDDIERTFFDNTFSGARQFRTDIVDGGDKYLLKAELPGFDKENISIDLDENTLTITAKQDEQTEESKDNYIRRERRYGAFCRSFDITGIDAGAIRAAYENGILSLDLPKQEPEPVPPARQIPIQ